MNIIVAGDGKVGSTLVRLLSAEGHDLTLIDLNQNTLESTVEQHDVMAVRGNCASMEVLLEAGVPEAAVDAWYLLEHITGLSRASYFVKAKDEMSEEDAEVYGAGLFRAG